LDVLHFYAILFSLGPGVPVNTGEQTLQISGITPINALPCSHVEGTVEIGVVLYSG